MLNLEYRLERACVTEKCCTWTNQTSQENHAQSQLPEYVVLSICVMTNTISKKWGRWTNNTHQIKFTEFSLHTQTHSQHRLSALCPLATRLRVHKTCHHLINYRTETHVYKNSWNRKKRLSLKAFPCHDFFFLFQGVWKQLICDSNELKYFGPIEAK